MLENNKSEENTMLDIFYTAVQTLSPFFTTYSNKQSQLINSQQCFRFLIDFEVCTELISEFHFQTIFDVVSCYNK